MRGHQVTHGFLYIPKCSVPLSGRDLLSKLGAQVAFSPHKRPTLRVGSTTYFLSFLVTPEDEWRWHHLQEGKQDGLNSRERERERERERVNSTDSSIPEVWAEDNPSPPTPQPRRLAKQVPLVIEVKPSTVTSAPALGLPDLAKPLTLYMTGKDKVAMGVLSQTLGTWDRPVAYLPKPLDNLATG